MSNNQNSFQLGKKIEKRSEMIRSSLINCLCSNTQATIFGSNRYDSHDGERYREREREREKKTSVGERVSEEAKREEAVRQGERMV